MTRPALLLLAFPVAILCADLRANDIQVTNATLTGNNIITGTCFVQFDLAWQNSWREGGVVNWDAAWVFAKYRTISGTWHHVKFNFTGHVLPSGMEQQAGLLTQGSAFNATSNPVMGFFIQRSVPGTGPINAAGVQLQWNYGGQFLAFNDIEEIRVYAVEMVFVNGGTFAAGSGGTETNAFTLTTIDRTPNTQPPSGSGALGGPAGGWPANASQAINPLYPNGFTAFYCMKYEVSQQQYVDFLNTLTRAQQDTRTATVLAAGNTAVTNRFVMTNSAAIQNRNGIACGTSIPANDPIEFHCDGNGNGVGNEVADGQWRACNFLATNDLCAYMAWSGLRPMTEMEFEKAARGPMIPLANGFAWGTTTLTGLNYSVSGTGSATEEISNFYNLVLGNAAYSSTAGTFAGPLRTGIFAAHPGNVGRVTSGASYYGIMELSGNVSELTIENTNGGDSFTTGRHGDGQLNTTGNASIIGWPGNFGVILRGGSFQNASSTLRISDRSNLGVNGLNVRQAAVGGRGVRTAP